MLRTTPVTIAILLCTFFAGAETVSLKGIVKKTGGTAGIAGVKVRLISIPELSVTTGADGTFILTGSTSAIKPFKTPNEPIQFMIKGNTIDTVPWGSPCQRIEGGDMIVYPVIVNTACPVTGPS